MIRPTLWLAGVGFALLSAGLVPRASGAREPQSRAPGVRTAAANRPSTNGATTSRAATANQSRSDEAQILAGAPLAQYYPADGLGGGTSVSGDMGTVNTTLYGTASNSVVMTGYFSQGPVYPWAYGGYGGGYRPVGYRYPYGGYSPSMGFSYGWGGLGGFGRLALYRRSIYSPGGLGGFGGFGAPFSYGYGFPYASGWFGIPYTYAAYGYPYSASLQPSYAYYGYSWPGGTGLYAPPTYFGYGGYGLPMGYYGYSGFSGYGGYIGMGPYGTLGGAYYW